MLRSPAFPCGNREGRRGRCGLARSGTRSTNDAFVVDLTQRKRAEAERLKLRNVEAELAHMSRITMMSELASSFAH